MAWEEIGSSDMPEAKAPDGEPVAFAELVAIVKAAYVSGTTMEEAERHAARFLEAQLNVCAELASLDLDARMKKNGMKAARAQCYMDICSAAEKKPTETAIESQITLAPLVNAAVDLFDRADARRENLTLYLSVFKDAHIHFRTIMRGAYSA